MTSCAVTQVLMPAMLAGMGAGAVTGSGWVAWIVGIAVGVGLVAYQSRSGRSAACAVQPRRAEADRAVLEELGDRPIARDAVSPSRPADR